MRATTVCVAILVALFSLLSAACAQHGTAEQSVLESRAARLQATIDADIETLSDYLADELTYSHASGWTETKSEYLTTVGGGTIDYVSVKPRDLAVRLYGDMAVVTGLSDMEGKLNGEPVGFTIRFLEVSRRIDDVWQLVAYQSVRFAAD